MKTHRTRSAATIDEADRALFREAVDGARPLRHDRVHHEPPTPPPRPVQREADERAALTESLAAPVSLDLRLEGGEEPRLLRPGLARSVLVDLRRGRWVVNAELDLHGHTRDQAQVALHQFIASAHARGHRCVRVIHGKGLGSPGREPVLKARVLNWLAGRGEVLAFCQARIQDGGSGALMVLLKALRRESGGTRNENGA